MRNRIGRPRFMQSFTSAGGGPFLATPPSDGETYGVRNADTWIEVCEEAPKNGTLYGRVSNAWQAIPSGGDPGTATGVLFTPAGDISATNVQAAIQELDNEKVAKAGSTMTGFLTLHANPDAPLKAATKQYVDTAFGNAGVTIGDAAPTPNQGKLWWESDTGVLWMSYTDVSSTQWISVGGTQAAISDASKADKTYVDAQDAAISTAVTAGDALRVLKAGDTMTGDLIINKPSTTVIFALDTDPLFGNVLEGRKSGKSRWRLQLGDGGGGGESGGNAGSNFMVRRFDDAGVAIDNPLYLTRATGALALNSTVPSTSPTTGALTVAGGVGIGGKCMVNDEIVCARAADSTTQPRITVYRDGSNFGFFGYGSDATLRCVYSSTAGNRPMYFGTTDGLGGLTISHTLNPANTPSTSPTTGALTVAGGVGISGSLRVGDTTQFGNGVAPIGTASHVFNGDVVLAYGGPSIFAFNSYYNAGTGFTSLSAGPGFMFRMDQTTWDLQISGAASVAAGVAQTMRAICTFNAFYPNVTINSTVASSSPTTGALVVSGGVGVGGSLHVAADIRTYFIGLNGPAFPNAISSARFSGASHYGSWIDDTDSVNNSIFAIFSIANAATTLGTIRNVGNSGVAYNTTSDIRGKPNREPLSLDIARTVIDALEVYDFDKDGNTIRGIGLVAQQAHGVHKSLATPGQKGEDWWMAEKAAPMPFVIANVQQLNRRLDALEQMFESNRD